MNFYTTPPIHQNFCAKAHFRRTRIKYFCIGVLPGLGQNRSVGGNVLQMYNYFRKSMRKI